MQVVLSGYTWRVISPSRFELDAAQVTLFFDSNVWRLAFDGETGDHYFATRDEAAAAIATGIEAYQVEQATWFS